MLILTGVLCSLLLCGYESKTQRVYDNADLLTPGEEQRVENALAQAIGKEKLDMIVVTTEDTGGYAAWQYAEYFYYDAGYAFGWENTDKGILLLIDMQHREVYVYYSEGAKSLFGESDVEHILDALYDSLRAGRYEDCCMDFIGAVEKYDSVISAGGVMLRVAISAAAAAVVVALMAYSQKTRMTVNGHVYARPGAFRIRYRRDFFTHTTTQTRRIESSSSGSGGGGGGGHSRGGGGGRSF